MTAPHGTPPTPAVRAMRAIGTTATVAVEDGGSRTPPSACWLSTWPTSTRRAAGSDPTRSSAGSSASARAVRCRSARSCSPPWRPPPPWRPAPPASSTRPSGPRWSSWVTTGTSTRRRGHDVPGPDPARPGWWQVRLERTAGTVAVPVGVHVDLGATGKAFAADRSAQRIADALGCGVLVNLGGDVAVAGPPRRRLGGRDRPRLRTAPADADEVVVLHAGGLASLGHHGPDVEPGRWRVHHIIDPWTGEVAPSTWALVSVLAPTCLEANGWSTAADRLGRGRPGQPGRPRGRGPAGRHRRRGRTGRRVADGASAATGRGPGDARPPPPPRCRAPSGTRSGPPVSSPWCC